MKFKAIFLGAFITALSVLPVAAQNAGSPGSNIGRNLLVCGDASTCPWQRGTSFASIANTGIMTADFWEAIGGASSNITISKVSQIGVNGFSQAIKFARTAANTDTAAIHLGQVLDSADFGTSLQGKTVCLSDNTLAGANFSAAGGVFTRRILAGTGSNEGYASMIAGTWTGTTTVATDTTVHSQGDTAAYDYVCAAIPSNATEVGIDYSFIPVGTAGANDWVELLGVQFETVSLPQQGPVAPSSFDNRAAPTERWLAQSRAYVLAEPAASISVGPSGQGASTTTCILSIPFPRTMRAAPTMTATGTALSSSTWTVTHVVTNTALSTPFLATTTGGNTASVANLTATTGAALTAGQTCTLTGAGGGSTLTFSADLS